MTREEANAVLSSGNWLCPTSNLSQGSLRNHHRYTGNQEISNDNAEHSQTVALECRRTKDEVWRVGELLEGARH